MIKNEVQEHDATKASGKLVLEKAEISWILGIDEKMLPQPSRAAGNKSFRSLTIDGETIEFSDGFTDLHTASYQQILAGKGYGLSETKPAIQLVHDIRNFKSV